MASKNPGKLSAQDKTAFIQTAQNLGLHPYELGGLIELESGFRPNVWGGAGGKYRGLIQFGPGARQEVGLPSRDMTIAEQLPYVEKYFQQRGYKPGMGIEKAYATVLVGNPGGSLSAKDSFGTSVGKAAPWMKPGGKLYQRAAAVLGDVDVPGTTQLQQDPTKQQGNVLQSQQTLPSGQQPINIFLVGQQGQKSQQQLSPARQLLKDFIGTRLLGQERPRLKSAFDNIGILSEAASTKYDF